MGTAIVLSCAAGLYHQRWFLDHTRKGQRLIRRFGDTGGTWVLRGLLIVGMALGGLLAAGVIHPVRWG
jgi:hypothetical protein